MKLIDRIALHKLLTTILNFILSVLKIVVPNKTEQDKKVWRPKWRRKNDE